jgi:CPA1 family monovalent cation:H+ antiporter
MSGIKLPRGTLEQRQADAARTDAARAAILAVERAMQQAGSEAKDIGLYTQAGARVLAQYREQMQSRLDAGDGSQPTRTLDGIERKLRIVALRAERDELYRIARSGQLTDEMTRALVREVDLQESRFSAH